MPGKAHRSISLGLSLALLLTGCSEPPSPEETASPNNDPITTVIPEALKTAVAEKTQAVCDTTAKLDDQVNQFLDAPSADTLDAARDSWRSAHETYQELAALYRLAELPPPQQYNERDPVDAHPMLPGYLDQVPNYPRSGLTFSEVPLTPEFLRKEHQSTDFFYLTLGFHPLEFLLWPKGSRPVDATLANFQTKEGATGEEKIDAAQRRRDLLRLIATALQRDTQSLCLPQNQAYLVTDLTQLYGAPSKAAVRLERTLAETVGTALANWSRNPEGEDRNGMPLAHSPQARSDFAEYSAVARYLKDTWVPLLLEDNEEARTDTQQALEKLAVKLAAVDLEHKPVAANALVEARDALTQFSENLTELAFQGQAAEY